MDLDDCALLRALDASPLVVQRDINYTTYGASGAKLLQRKEAHTRMTKEREDASARRGATAIRARDAIIAHGFDRPRATTRSGAARACARLKDE